jgi:hypothetical protein
MLNPDKPGWKWARLRNAWFPEKCCVPEVAGLDVDIQWTTPGGLGATRGPVGYGAGLSGASRPSRTLSGFMVSREARVDPGGAPEWRSARWDAAPKHTSLGAAVRHAALLRAGKRSNGVFRRSKARGGRGASGVGGKQHKGNLPVSPGRSTRHPGWCGCVTLRGNV